MRHYTEGEVIKHLRESFTPRAGQTQTQVAAKLGFSVQYIHAVLAGRAGSRGRQRHKRPVSCCP